MGDRGRRRRSRNIRQRRKPRCWVTTVTTVSTKPPPGLFTRDAATIARVLVSPRVSPKGPTSGLRMLSFYINRAGRQLSRSRRAELDRAKRLMRGMIAARGARQ
jgi:tRNA(adenine34) deaminase